jgi:glucokinase
MSHENPKNHVVGVDIGLEQTTLALMDVRGNIKARDGFPTGTSPNIGNFVSVLSERTIHLMQENGGSDHIRSVGVCCHSANHTTGCIENAANLPWKGSVPLAAMLRDRLGMAVALGNNAHARALGEHAYGVAHGMENFILLSLGSGLGSCIFSNGRVHRGRDGFAGEIGHTCARVDGRLCGCGNKGCLEMYTSAKGMLATARELMDESDQPSKLRQVEQLTFPLLVAFFRQQDPLAREAVRRSAYMLGVGLANYASVVNPEAFIFTGRATALGGYLLDEAKKSFEDHVFHNARGKVKFLLSSFDESEANLMGAGVLAWSVKEYSLFK